MSDSVVLQRVTTLQRVKTGMNSRDPFVLFMGKGRAQLELPLDEWQEMGCPEFVRMTLERG